MMNDEQKQAMNKRLARIAGQVAGIQRMVEDDRYCVDILLQITAVRTALTRAAQNLLAAHIDTCIRDAFENGTQHDREVKLQEIFDVFRRFGKL